MSGQVHCLIGGGRTLVEQSSFAESPGSGGGRIMEYGSFGWQFGSDSLVLSNGHGSVGIPSPPFCVRTVQLGWSLFLMERHLAELVISCCAALDNHSSCRSRQIMRGELLWANRWCCS